MGEWQGRGKGEEINIPVYFPGKVFISAVSVYPVLQQVERTPASAYHTTVNRAVCFCSCIVPALLEITFAVTLAG